MTGYLVPTLAVLREKREPETGGSISLTPNFVVRVVFQNPQEFHCDFLLVESN